MTVEQQPEASVSRRPRPALLWLLLAAVLVGAYALGVSTTTLRASASSPNGDGTATTVQAQGSSSAGGSAAGRGTTGARRLTVTVPAVDGLAPGVTRPLLVRVQNDGPEDVRLDSLTPDVQITGTSACPAGSVTVTSFRSDAGPLLRGRGGSADVPLQVTLRETGTNQDVCKATSFAISVQATGTQARA